MTETERDRLKAAIETFEPFIQMFKPRGGHQRYMLRVVNDYLTKLNGAQLTADTRELEGDFREMVGIAWGRTIINGSQRAMIMGMYASGRDKKAGP